MADPVRILSLCSGIGSLDLAVARALGGARIVAHVEGEAFACASLAFAGEVPTVARAPVWTDLRSFDASPFRGVVDLVTAGLPCQPYSLAGERSGNADPRALWPHFCRVVEECEPAALFLENVPQFVRGGFFAPAWHRLCELGFRFGPPLFSTSAEYGAPHDRERVFVFAAHADRGAVWAEPGGVESGGSGASESGDAGAGVADAGFLGRRIRKARVFRRRWRAAERTDPELTDAHVAGRGELGIGWLFDRDRQTLRHHPDGCDLRCRICGSPWEAESPPVRLAHADPDRIDRLRAVGNAVCVTQAEAAFRYLARRATASAPEDGRSKE